MSVVLLHVAKGTLYLMGDKRETILTKSEDNKNIVFEKRDNTTKIFKINDDVLIGCTGATNAYRQLLENILDSDFKVFEKAKDWNYSTIKSKLNYIYPQYYEYLKENSSRFPYGDEQISFQVLLCGKVNDKFYTSEYGYYPEQPIENLSGEREFNKNSNTVAISCKPIFKNQYTNVYMSQEDFQKGLFNEDSILKSFQNTLQIMSSVDDAISTNYDVLKLQL